MTDTAEPAALTRAALQGVLDELLRGCAADRCTLRLDHPSTPFGVVVEARGDGVGTLIGETTVALAGQPVVEAMRTGTAQVVQDDCVRADDDPAFRRMLQVYGGLSAQIVTAVRVDGVLRGIVSVHVLGGTRAWTGADTDMASAACELIGRILA